MTRLYTTAKLLQATSVRAGVPVLQELFPASEQLLLADEIMQDSVIPLVMQYRKGHFLAVYDQTTTTSTSYAIHTEAMDLGLFNVTLVGTGGREYPLEPIDFDAEIGKRPRPDDGADPTSSPWAYYVRGDLLYVYPSCSAGLTLRQHFYRRPNRLCRSAAYTYNAGSEAAEAVQVVSVNTGTGAITCTTSSVPSTITTSTPVCVVKGTPGFGLKIATSSNPTAVTSSVVTLGSDIADVAAAGIVAGDWVCLAGDSPVIQLPVEAHGILAQRLAVKLLEALGDSEGLVSAKADLEAIEKRYKRNFPLRVEQAPKEVTSVHRLADGVIGY